MNIIITVKNSNFMLQYNITINTNVLFVYTVYTLQTVHGWKKSLLHMISLIIVAVYRAMISSVIFFFRINPTPYEI